MSREKLSQGWSQALALYESARTLNVVEPAFLNGRPRNTHFSPERGFMISWPNGWNPDSMLSEFYGRQLPHEGAKLLLVLVPQCLVGGMRPFVAVTVEEGVGESVEAYMESRLRVGGEDLAAVVRSVPADVGSVLRFFHLRPFKGPSHERVFSVYKVALFNSRAYVVSVMQLAESALIRREDLCRSVESILSSFAVVVA